MMGSEEPIPYTKKELKQYRKIKLRDKDTKLYDAIHADARQASTIMQWKKPELGGDWFSSFAKKLSRDQLEKIGAAFIYIDNKLDPHSDSPPTREEVQGVFSCVYHLFNDNSEKGMHSRTLLSQASTGLKIDLLPKECLYDEDMQELLEAIFIQRLRHR